MITIPKETKGLIFDLDGTLLDSMPLHYEAYNHCLEPWGVHYDYEIFASRGGIPTQDTLQLIVEENNIEGFNMDKALKMKRSYVESRLDKITPIETTFNIMKSYQGKLPMSIGTGSNRQTVDEVYKIFGLGEYISHTVTATDVQHFKPHPETFLKCASLMGVSPKDCLVFEDGEPGIEAAITAGMKVVDIRPYL